MPRGGVRPGAGRKKGAAGRATAEAREMAKAAGETPLEYMLRVMHDEAADTKRRDGMAAAAAPYIHPKLASIEHSGPDGGPIPISAEHLRVEIAGELDRIRRNTGKGVS